MPPVIGYSNNYEDDDQPKEPIDMLGVKAAVEKDKISALQAILLDPLTSAVLTIGEIRQMVYEMSKVEEKYLDGFR